jgi:hypothetical protein
VLAVAWELGSAWIADELAAGAQEEAEKAAIAASPVAATPEIDAKAS